MILAAVNVGCPICMGRVMNVLFFHPFGHLFLPLFEITTDHDKVLIETKQKVEPVLYDPLTNTYHIGMPDNRLIQYEIITALTKIHAEAIKRQLKDFVLLPAPAITVFNDFFEHIGRETVTEHLPSDGLIDANFEVLSKISDILKTWP